MAREKCKQVATTSATTGPQKRIGQAHELEKQEGEYETDESMLELAKRFGKEAIFGVGLCLLPMVFFPLIAFGSGDSTSRRSLSDLGNLAREWRIEDRFLEI